MTINLKKTENMKRLLTLLLMAAWAGLSAVQAQYVPTPENLDARREFEGFRFGIFLHWGIYAEFAQGEWYLQTGELDGQEYAKAASCFYPLRFDAQEWVKAFREAGAKYVTFTSRHHDGFSMWPTKESKYNIMDATPFKRDVVGELAKACADQGISLHLYYSTLDWHRTDYPLGRTGLKTGRTMQPDFDHYMQFMKNQCRELLTQYPNVDALWFDGNWDHDEDSVPFNWRMPEFYSYLHSLKPSVLLGNNHHSDIIEGEDYQMFERDVPGENTAGYSEGQKISQLPLEMCQTMNGAWGYKVKDQNYKSVDELVRLIVRCASKGANLLLNIGPQPNGELPRAAINRLHGIGQWMQAYGETIYNTRRGPIEEMQWGVTTVLPANAQQRPAGKTYPKDLVFLHVLERSACHIDIPCQKKPAQVIDYITREPLTTHFNKKAQTLTIELPEHEALPDYVVEMK